MNKELSQLSLCIQEYIKFYNILNKNKTLNKEIKEQSYEILQNMIKNKSKIEGSESPIQDDPNFGQELKHSKKSFLQLKSYIRGNTLEEINKHKNIKELILKEVFNAVDDNINIIYISLICSPWFSHTQDDRQSKARKNILFFVYRQSTENCLGIENQHSIRRKELFSVEGNDEWIIGRELRSFIDLLFKTQYRYIAALSNKDNILYQTDIWNELCNITNNGSIFYKTNQFIQKITSQAIALVSVRDKKQKPKKNKSKTVKQYYTENHIMSSLAQQDIIYFCESFHLIFDVASICLNKPLLDWENWERITTPPKQPDSPNDITFETFEKFINEYREYICYHLYNTTYKSSKESDICLYNSVFIIINHIELYKNKYLSKLPFNIKNTHINQYELWLGNIRNRYIYDELICNVDKISLNSIILNDYQQDIKGLNSLINEIGKPLADLNSNQILFLVENGSRMYDVALPNSDRDYIAIFKANTMSILSTLQWPKESMDNRGFQYEIEHCCYEIRMFCELLLKGNPSVIELLYTDRVAYMTEAWKILLDNRDKFISENVVFQYISWIKFHLKLINSKRNPTKASKYFYHVFHKLYELKRLANKESIHVKVSGEEQQFIIKIRTSTMTEEYFDYLLNLANKQLEDMIQLVSNRTWRYPESGDWRLLNNWILSLRAL